MPEETNNEPTCGGFLKNTNAICVIMLQGKCKKGIAMAKSIE